MEAHNHNFGAPCNAHCTPNATRTPGGYVVIDGGPHGRMSLTSERAKAVHDLIQAEQDEANDMWRSACGNWIAKRYPVLDIVRFINLTNGLSTTVVSGSERATYGARSFMLHNKAIYDAYMEDAARRTPWATASVGDVWKIGKTAETARALMRGPVGWFDPYDMDGNEVHYIIPEGPYAKHILTLADYRRGVTDA